MNGGEEGVPASIFFHKAIDTGGNGLLFENVVKWQREEDDACPRCLLFEAGYQARSLDIGEIVVENDERGCGNGRLPNGFFT